MARIKCVHIKKTYHVEVRGRQRVRRFGQAKYSIAVFQVETLLLGDDDGSSHRGRALQGSGDLEDRNQGEEKRNNDRARCTRGLGSSLNSSLGRRGLGPTDRPSLAREGAEVAVRPRSAAKGADESHVGAGMAAADDVDSSCSPCRQLYQGPDALLARLAALL